jgi:hypothetical protein
MFHEGVRNPQALDFDRRDPFLLDQLEDGAAESSLEGIFLYCDHALNLGGEGADQCFIQRFDIPGVDYRGAPTLVRQSPGRL